MQPDHRAQEYAPEQPAPTAPRKQCHAQNQLWQEVPAREPDVKRIARQVRGITGEPRGLIVFGFSLNDPADMRPPEPVTRRMWIARTICMGVMNAMRCHPINRAALHGQRATHGQRIFHPLRRAKTAVREQTVITDTDAHTATKPKENQAKDQCLPTEKEERRYCSHVQHGHYRYQTPVHCRPAFATQCFMVSRSLLHQRHCLHS